MGRLSRARYGGMNVKGKENLETRVKVEVETQQHEGGCVRWNSNKSIKRKPCSWRTKVRWPVGGDLGCVILIHETDAPLIQGQGARPLAALTQPGAGTLHPHLRE
jgi:hypothetical protein